MAKVDHLAKAKKALSTFLTNNPSAQLEKTPDAHSAVTILRPWNDDSLQLVWKSISQAEADTLNNIILPESLSAIYHCDTSHMEFIYSPFPLPPRLNRREFNFTFGDATMKCRFGPASSALKLVASMFAPTRQRTETDFRNLIIMSPSSNLVLRSTDGKIAREQRDPHSFWVGPIQCSDAYLRTVARHLNFYMSYFDPRSPRILIHEVLPEQRPKASGETRELAFPADIAAVEIDDELLHLWEAGRRGDHARGFVYNYQVLEYAAHYVLEEDTRRRLRRILSAPARSSSASTIAEIIDMLADGKAQEGSKITWLLQRSVDPKVIFDFVSSRRDVFCKDTEFDGGVVAKALMSMGADAELFSKNWAGAFAGSARSIRNALSHGRESRQTRIIAPTKNNLHKLKDWTKLISIVAHEVIIYRGEA